eukprot:2737760-Pleurochrysis_carterae.AAC.1
MAVCAYVRSVCAYVPFVCACAAAIDASVTAASAYAKAGSARATQVYATVRTIHPSATAVRAHSRIACCTCSTGLCACMFATAEYAAWKTVGMPAPKRCDGACEMNRHASAHTVSHSACDESAHACPVSPPPLRPPRTRSGAQSDET